MRSLNSRMLQRLHYGWCPVVEIHASWRSADVMCVSIVLQPPPRHAVFQLTLGVGFRYTRRQLSLYSSNAFGGDVGVPNVQRRLDLHRVMTCAAVSSSSMLLSVSWRNC